MDDLHKLLLFRCSQPTLSDDWANVHVKPLDI